ncbi:MAG: RnfABCDGE type electron transport complex subunit G [Prevotella sp.]|jgi:electron transport complex protein RnfG|nr:RnfABCDGE type electron transport complex subunit G [Prevotella sp.]MBQ7451483.1 RnfABCDGE type electron transport complex subunit G [Prevotella sp.]MBQ8058586.1 RnfABCDGE type electron transport complex subunit G [Prevotella sp.]MBQ8114737.1 RnfABCDGE type electron transport complex subunit G [Prevotella sp.]
MEKLKSNLPNMVGILTTVAVLCGGILAYVNDLTDAPRKEAAQNALNAGIEQVMGGKCKVEKPDTIKRTVDGKELTYIAYKTDKGTAIQSTDPNGFGGNLTVLVGFNNAGDILGYTILETAETPGLGAKADKWFQSVENGGNSEKSSIIGKNPAKNQLRVTKDNDGGEIDAITASTITSRAFLRAVQEAYNTYAENK